MSVQSDIAEIKALTEEHEDDLKRARRSGRKLHNLLAAKMAAHAELLGLSDGDVITFGGGTPKTPPPDDG